MAITDKSNLDGASTEYSELFQREFKLDDGYTAYVGEVPMNGKKIVEFPFMTNFPEPRTWIGKKEFKATRANKATLTAKHREASTEIDRFDWTTDPAGAGAQIRAWLNSAAGKGFRAKFVNSLLVNAETDLGYDGVSFLNETHPNGVDGGTQSNWSSGSAFSRANLIAGGETMMALRDESGAPLMRVPDTLVCGPSMLDLAKEVTQASLRTQGLAGDGTIDGGTRVAAASIDNLLPFSIERIVVDYRLVGAHASKVFIFDTKGKPALVVGVAEAEKPTDDSTEYKSGNPVVKCSIEAVLAFGYGDWTAVHAIY